VWGTSTRRGLRVVDGYGHRLRYYSGEGRQAAQAIQL
jgi:hypothetical protein